jgi:hypothetical protein
MQRLESPGLLIVRKEFSDGTMNNPEAMYTVVAVLNDPHLTFAKEGHIPLHTDSYPNCYPSFLDETKECHLQLRLLISNHMTIIQTAPAGIAAKVTHITARARSLCGLSEISLSRLALPDRSSQANPVHIARVQRGWLGP